MRTWRRYVAVDGLYARIGTGDSLVSNPTAPHSGVSDQWWPTPPSGGQAV